MMILRTWLTILLIFVTACKSRDPHPELKDSLYLSFVFEQSAAEKQYLDSKKLYDESVVDLNKPQSATQIPKVARVGAYHKALRDLEKSEQTLAYAKARVRVRLKHVRLEYNHAFSEGKEWPTSNTSHADLQIFRQARKREMNYSSVHDKKVEAFRATRKPASSKKPEDSSAPAAH